MSTWRWEAFDLAGNGVIADILTDPFAATVEQAAELAMAHLMVRARPEFRRLTGWRVRAWGDGMEAWVCADQWLPTMDGAGR